MIYLNIISGLFSVYQICVTVKEVVEAEKVGAKVGLWQIMARQRAGQHICLPHLMSDVGES